MCQETGWDRFLSRSSNPTPPWIHPAVQVNEIFHLLSFLLKLLMSAQRAQTCSEHLLPASLPGFSLHRPAACDKVQIRETGNVHCGAACFEKWHKVKQKQLAALIVFHSFLPKKAIRSMAERQQQKRLFEEVQAAWVNCSAGRLRREL